MGGESDGMARDLDTTYYAVQDATEPTEFGCCVVCGEFIDYCQGHGAMSDPQGYKILQQHDSGDHSNCNPMGCDEANAR